MTKAVALFTGGITELRQAAIREDGAVFTRIQTKTRFGYSWSKWRTTGEVLGHNAATATDEVECGFATLRRASANDCCINNRAWFNAAGEIKVRLP